MPGRPSRVRTVPLAEVELVGGPRERLELGLGAAGEERDLLQELDLGVAAERHGKDHTQRVGKNRGRGASGNVELGLSDGLQEG